MGLCLIKGNFTFSEVFGSSAFWMLWFFSIVSMIGLFGTSSTIFFFWLYAGELILDPLDSSSNLSKSSSLPLSRSSSGSQSIYNLVPFSNLPENFLIASFAALCFLYLAMT